MNLLIQRATVVTDGRSFRASVAVEDGCIAAVSPPPLPVEGFDEVVEAEGLWLLPGVIDTHVHFRDPGLTHKGDFATESRAAAAGGVTTVFDMPNTVPQTTTAAALLEKAAIAAEKSVVRTGFYLGATHENAATIADVDPALYCGVKVFLGASTGGMLLDSDEPLAQVFRTARKPVVAHCEDQSILSDLYTRAREQYAATGDAPIALHSRLRPAAACVSATR
ncbi:MAG: amidohydrolase family protein, partial [Bacteroidaceae bacterium]|nr:amidohydrolase family protein [Bacteroidaceae bacterium]